MIIFESSKRATAGLSAMLIAALAMTACGSGNEDAGDTGNNDAEAAETDGYPVTVETVYGEITLEEKPERIVALGGAYIDQLAALGENPVAYVGSPRAGEDLIAGYPWFEDLGLDAEGHDLSLRAEGYTPSLEAVAAYEPDLIIGDGADWAIDEAMNEEIQEIAPTYTPPHAAHDWEDILADLGELTGQSDEAQDAISSVEAEFAQAREDLASLEGSSYIFADLFEQELSLSAEVPLLEGIGLEPDADLADAESLSLESIDELTADVIYIMTWRQDDTVETLESDPRFNELPAVQNDAVIYADATLTNALADTGPASVSWWLEQVVPQLEDSELNQGAQ